jgi:hypothetical protein
MARQANTQTLSMSLQGDEELQAAIAEIVRNTDDLREAWKRFYRPAFYEYVDEWWQDEGRGATGKSWRPLKKRYKKWKMAHGGGELMVFGGDDTDLKGALKGGGNKIFTTTPKRMTIGAKWSTGNTPWGRMIIYAEAPQMQRHMTDAARDHAEWYAKKWSGR